jgi:hypothetical protein
MRIILIYISTRVKRNLDSLGVGETQPIKILKNITNICL